MTSPQSAACSRCGSRSFVDERIVEHDCGHVASLEAFEEGCEKCDRPVDDENLVSLQTVDRCLECGHRSPLPLETESIGPLQAAALPTLPTAENHLNWVPERLVPESRTTQRLLSTALVLLVLVAGIAGAVSVTPMLDEEPTEQPVVEPTWEEYESIVVFRNDDIQPWYNQEELHAVSDVFIEEEVPVTLGIIPDTNGDAALTDDPVLCEYLRSLETDHPGQFEMALHGHTHEPETDFYDGSEFGDLPRDEQRERLADGEELLADCVDSPSSTFIPPMNTYDDTTVEVLEEANYTTVSGGQWFTDQYFDANGSTVFEEGGILHVPETQAFEDWSAYQDGDGYDSEDSADTGEETSGNETEADDVPFEDLETMTASFDEAHEDNEIHVVMLHYQYFTTDDRLEQLESLIQHMKAEEDVGFMTLEQLALGLETGAVEETDDGWRVLEPISEVSR